MLVVNITNYVFFMRVDKGEFEQIFETQETRGMQGYSRPLQQNFFHPNGLGLQTRARFWL